MPCTFIPCGKLTLWDHHVLCLSPNFNFVISWPSSMKLDMNVMRLCKRAQFPSFYLATGLTCDIGATVKWYMATVIRKLCGFCRTILIVVIMRTVVFWNWKPSIPVVAHHFRGGYWPRPQGRRPELSLRLLLDDIFFGLLFSPEDGGTTALGKVDLFLSDNMAIHARRQNSVRHFH
jgi:hypothetical protein